ncbi:MAG: single-stranded DNA-binding protein [Treponema sp.]|nr:single-stranded DNA-binding protein [Treponema sp.]
MNQLNSLIIEGNVVKNGELSEPTKGFKVCVFPVAVNRFYKNKNGEGVSEVSYFDVQTFGKMAELCEKQAEKGRGVRVVGRLKQDRWKDNDGKSKSKVFVVAEHIEYKPKFETDEKTKSDAGSKSVKQTEAVEDYVAEEETVF